MKYDVMVVGSGIAGMESSIKLGDMGYKVLLVEKEASVGGRMILLSKVFPTLDCASCISGPKMSSTINHPNITTMTYSEVKGIRREAGRSLQRHDQGEGAASSTGPRAPGARTARRRAPSPCPTSSTPTWSRGTPPTSPSPRRCRRRRSSSGPAPRRASTACPAGIKAHGYVSLIRSGKYEEAFQLVLEATPLVGTLGRACYAPCESECTRAKLEGSIPIRRLKRFAADRHYANGETRRSGHRGRRAERPQRRRSSGSGPAGLTAAWQLARARATRSRSSRRRPQPGGFLRHAIPAYRLPHEVVDAGHRQRHLDRRRDRAPTTRCATSRR